MEIGSSHWLPLTEYALRSGMSISTLRRKIKTNAIEYKMEEGRYLIRSDDLQEERRVSGFVSTDAPRPTVVSAPSVLTSTPPIVPVQTPAALDREEVLRMQEDNVLRWRALDARVAGLAKRLELFTEQVAELKMLVNIFEEKLDHRA